MIGDRRVVGLRTEWIWCKDIKYLDASSNLIDMGDGVSVRFECEFRR